MPTAWFICPDFDSPSGGIRKLYRFVDILNDAGMPASILHGRRGFCCSWFPHRTVVNSAGAVNVMPNDILVVPEIYGGNIRKLPDGIKQIILNQNAYITLRSLADNSANDRPYLDNADLSAVLTVSDDNAETLSYLFPGVPLRRLRLGIDPTLHYRPASPKLRRIVYMPRKRPDDAAAVFDILRRRGILDGWEVSAVGGLSEERAAEQLRSASIFLSFSSLEGFGLPPLEAMACGCVVIGYHGFGGREYFNAPYGVPIEDGDTIAFARAVESCIRAIDTGSPCLPDPEAVHRLVDRYSLEAERLSVIEAFQPYLQPHPYGDG